MINKILQTITMNTYTTLDDVNTTDGVHTIITYTADVVPIFIPLTLFAFFTIACLGSYYASIRLNNRGDLPSSFAAAGFITSILATAMTLIPGLINLATLTTVYGFTILGVIWLFFSKNN